MSIHYWILFLLGMFAVTGLLHILGIVAASVGILGVAL